MFRFVPLDEVVIKGGGGSGFGAITKLIKEQAGLSLKKGHLPNIVTAVKEWLGRQFQTAPNPSSLEALQGWKIKIEPAEIEASRTAAQDAIRKDVQELAEAAEARREEAVAAAAEEYLQRAQGAQRQLRDAGRSGAASYTTTNARAKAKRRDNFLPQVTHDQQVRKERANERRRQAREEARRQKEARAAEAAAKWSRCVDIARDLVFNLAYAYEMGTHTPRMKEDTDIAVREALKLGDKDERLLAHSVFDNAKAHGRLKAVREKDREAEEDDDEEDGDEEDDDEEDGEVVYHGKGKKSSGKGKLVPTLFQEHSPVAENRTRRAFLLLEGDEDVLPSTLALARARRKKFAPIAKRVFDAIPTQWAVIPGLNGVLHIETRRATRPKIKVGVDTSINPNYDEGNVHSDLRERHTVPMFFLLLARLKATLQVMQCLIQGGGGEDEALVYWEDTADDLYKIFDDKEILRQSLAWLPAISGKPINTPAAIKALHFPDVDRDVDLQGIFRALNLTKRDLKRLVSGGPRVTVEKLMSQEDYEDRKLDGCSAAESLYVI